MSRLIVNADDFGLTSGVNRAIVELNRQQLLTSATLMTRAAATDQAIELTRSTPALGVGCHVVLVDGRPTLPPMELTTLVDRQTGQFEPTLGRFLQQLLPGGIRSAEIEMEAAAQIERLTAAGLKLTHVDTHKHTHMFPAVLRPVLRAARAAGIRGVRNPFEPAWSAQATPGAPWLRRMQVNLLRRLEAGFRRIVAEEGFVTTNGATGVLATGTLDRNTVASLLRAAPEGTWELVTHPGYSDSELAQVHTRLVASRDRERQALEVLRSAENVRLISFADL